MRAYILECEPGSRFHFGKYAPDANTALSSSSVIIHSDTLFSAIVNTYNDIYNDTDELVSHFEIGNITISSCNFCFNYNGNYVWFLPKPISFNFAKVKDHKSFKRIRYISKGIWEQLESPIKLLNDDVKIIQNEFALLESELTGIKDYHWRKLRIYNSINVPKVQVRKPTQEGTLYNLNIIEIADNEIEGFEVNYYFLVEYNDQFVTSNQFNKFGSALKVLGYNGIGAERATIGKLKGISAPLDWNLDVPENQIHCNLSLLNPRAIEYSGLLFYDTLFRGGRRIGRGEDEENKPDRKTFLRSVRMLAEGAVVKYDVKGQVVNITPEQNYTHGKFKRNGRAITVPLKKSWLLS